MSESPTRATSDPVSARTADLLSLSSVHRWNVIATLRPQNVADHCFRVAVIVMELFDRLKLPEDQLVYGLVWALCHDWPETLTSDIDGKFKRENQVARLHICKAENEAFPAYKQMSVWIPKHIKAIVKLADYIEAVTFIAEWGHGQRATAVQAELYGILYDEAVPAVSSALNRSDDRVRDVVRMMTYRIELDVFNVQARTAEGFEVHGPQLP